MLVRHPNIEFAAGALVFPGGAVDDSDRGTTTHAVVTESARHLDPRELAWQIAAVREVYEECGVLLARERGSPALIDADRLAGIDALYHEDLSNHSLDIVALALAENIELACDALIPFAHWITPQSRPKRFDTRFYVAGAPFDQLARHDGHESVHSLWGEPGVICTEDQRRKMAFEISDPYESREAWPEQKRRACAGGRAQLDGSQDPLEGRDGSRG